MRRKFDMKALTLKMLKEKIGCGENTTERQDDLLLAAYELGREDEKHAQDLEQNDGVF